MRDDDPIPLETNGQISKILWKISNWFLHTNPTSFTCKKYPFKRHVSRHLSIITQNNNSANNSLTESHCKSLALWMERGVDVPAPPCNLKPHGVTADDLYNRT